jgi:adenosylhomocysteine nucleosidase
MNLYLCAMPVEAQALPASATRLISGPGFRAASAALTQYLAVYRPARVISIGVCGALDPALSLGQVLTVSRIQSPLGVFSPQPLTAPAVTLHSQDRVAVSAFEKRQLFATGAHIVDMEAAAVALLCQGHGIPFYCLKAVSDLADEDLPIDFNLYRDAAGNFSHLRIAIAGIMKITALIRLQRQTRIAVKGLQLALDAALADIA